MTTKALILASHFPGLGSRSVGIIKRLPALGVETTVITQSSVRGPRDPTTAREVKQSGVRVIETFAFHRSPFRILRRFLGLSSATRWCDDFFFFPDFDVLWAPFAVRAATRLIRREKIDVIMTISPPESIHLVGLIVQRITGVRWLADFEDLWSAKTHVNRKPTPLHNKGMRALEKRVYERCSLLVANTRMNAGIYQRDFAIPREKIAILPLGFDPGDSLAQDSTRPRDGFTIGYLGNLTKELFPWQELLQALKSARSRAPGMHIRLEICGYVSGEGVRYIAAEGLSDAVTLHGVLSHRDAVAIIRNCDALAVLLYETPYSRPIVPHKLYHYLGMRKPILGIADEDGEVASLLEKTNTGHVFSIKHLSELESAILSHAETKRALGNIPFHPNEQEIELHDVTRIATDLADLLRGIDHDR
jgi:glycosyltransferase involved in cell wall biosynthesis